MKETCSLAGGWPLLPVMLRVIALVGLSGCGGFVTPPQNVAVGIALTSAGDLPPRLEKDNHVLVLTRLRVTGSLEVDKVQLAVFTGTEASLASGWTELAQGPLERGDYPDVKLDLTGLSLDGTYDGKAFHLESNKPRRQDLHLNSSWRVELGKMSALSLVAEPKRWMIGSEGPGKEGLIEPDSSEAADGLMNRFFDSLTAARDDNHDGVEDP